MAKARLLQAVCAVAMLAAAPAFAQTDTQPADTGAHNKANTPMAPATMAPAEKMGSPHHHAADAMHARSSTSQDAAVDQLNNESYQAAQRGQAFSASNMGSGGSTTPAGSGSMNDMSGGSMGNSNAPAAGGAGSK